MHFKSISTRKNVCLIFAAGCALALTGCASLWRSSRHQSSSVVQFLYPGKDQPFVQPGIPTLRLPLRVGVAFVPPARAQGEYQAFDDTFAEAQKAGLMREVAAQFKALPFVQSIELVPTAYLRPGGSFENLDQLRAIMGVDVIALISYDQAQNTNDTGWSFTYWTLLGAYVVPAQKNVTYTLMEAVVYDIASRSLLFRAPGVSTIKGHATLISNETDLRADSTQSYAAAAADLTVNLQKELAAFKVRAKSEPESIHIEHKPGFSLGGGSIEGWFAAALALLLVGRLPNPLRAFCSRAK